jgi:hypothetical protein
MDVISTELRSSFYKEANERTLFFGKTSGRSTQERSSLGFTWFGYPRISRGIASEERPVSELIAVRYFVKEHSDDDKEDGEPLSNAGALYKVRWNPYEGEENGYDAEVMANVERFALSYFDGKDWLDGWDASNENKLPAAVKVELTLRDEESTQLYSSIVKVIMSDEASEGGFGQ